MEFVFGHGGNIMPRLRPTLRRLRLARQADRTTLGQRHHPRGQPHHQQPVQTTRRPTRRRPTDFPTVSCRWSLSTAAPNATSHSTATATTRHIRSTRPGSVMRVFCQCHSPPSIILNCCSTHARNPYHSGLADEAGRSVRNAHGSSCPASQQPNSVHASGCSAVW